MAYSYLSPPLPSPASSCSVASPYFGCFSQRHSSILLLLLVVSLLSIDYRTDLILPPFIYILLGFHDGLRLIILLFRTPYKVCFPGFVCSGFMGGGAESRG